MAIVDMKKITLVGLHDERHRVLARLMEIGAMDIVEADIDERLSGNFQKKLDEEDIRELEGKIGTLEKAIGILKPFDERKKQIFKVRKDIDTHAYRSVVFKRHDVLEKASEINSINGEMLEEKSRINKNRNTLASLGSWSALSIPVDIDATANTSIIKGMLPAAADVDEIKDTIERGELACEISVAGKDNEQIYLTAFVHRDDYEEAMTVLKRNGFSSTDFKGFEGGIDENINNVSKNIEKAGSRIEEVEGRLAEHSGHLDEIEIVYDYYMIRKDISLTGGDIASGKRIFYIEGWIPAPAEESLVSEMKEKWTVHIMTRDPYEDEGFPVMLENGFVGDSVQDITEMYSLPHHESVDPNPVMAPFFILFFGLMFSDAGYGLVMAGAGAFLYFFVKLEEKMKRFMKMMMLCGFATIFWGALFGSWFGNLIPILSGNPGRDISIWFSPIDNPEYLLMWSLLFGVIHLYIGLAMRGANLVKKKQYLAVLFDVVFWYVFFTGAIFMVLSYVPGVSPELAETLAPYGTYMLPIGGALLLLTQGRKSKTIGGKIVGGLASIYDLVNFMSDVLSYSRLLALGLATSVIATIVNDMGSMSGFNVFGILVFILVFLAGHTLNFMLNALSAYVHSSRLQYIEFFNKFFEGGGRPFRPFKRNTKYIRIRD